MSTPEPPVEKRVEKLEQKERRRLHSGIAVWAVAVLVGIAVGLIVLGAANRYSDHQRERATRQAAIKLNEKTQKVARELALKQYRSSIAACKRGNILRRDINDTTRTQGAFLHTALIARQRAVQTAKTDADRKLNEDAAEVYATLLKHAHIVPIVDCAHSFTKP